MTVLTIEAAGKYGPKANGEWYGLKKPLKPADFEKDQSYEVELEEWSKGRFNIVKAKLADEGKPAVKKEVAKQKAETKSKDDNKNERILVQGVTQSVISSPALASLPFADKDELVERIKEVAKELVEYVRQESK